MSREPLRAVRAVLATIALLAATATVGVVALVAPAGAATGCGITWGSLAKENNTMSQALIVTARAGRHACYDRFVVELRGTPAPGWRAQYVSRVVQDGSGDPVPLRGGAFIQLAVLAPAYDGTAGTYTPARPSEAVSTAGFSTLRQVTFGGTFEAVTTFGIGVRARLPFRVFVLPGPGSGSRLVVDVAHSWR